MDPGHGRIDMDEESRKRLRAGPFTAGYAGAAVATAPAGGASVQNSELQPPSRVLHMRALPDGAQAADIVTAVATFGGTVTCVPAPPVRRPRDQ